MTDYSFYTDTYMGSLIPEKAFPEMALRAGEHLARIQRNYRVTASGTDSLHMAICAMAETVETATQRAIRNSLFVFIVSSIICYGLLNYKNAGAQASKGPRISDFG